MGKYNGCVHVLPNYLSDFLFPQVSYLCAILSLIVWETLSQLQEPQQETAVLEQMMDNRIQIMM